jgi:YYY domain-containing protein
MIDLSLIGFAATVIIFAINHVIGLALMLAFWAALLLFSARPDARRQLLLCMIGLGLIFTAVVEVVVLKGDISRMNTVFKFYLQVWVLWGIASAAILPELARTLRIAPHHDQLPLPKLEEGTAWTPQLAAEIEKLRPRSKDNWSRRWWWAFSLLLVACFLYPLTAAPVRMRDRFKDSTTSTIDGTAYMRTSIYYDDSRPVTLEWDRQAFDWLRKNVHGIPTILEANTPLYRWGSRVSIYTGLPTIIGWDWHQKQQRSVLPGSVIEHRIEDVRTIYNSTDDEQTKKLLKAYDVKYIYVGALERLYYDPTGLSKFDQKSDLWSLVYQNEQVKIYQVH